MSLNTHSLSLMIGMAAGLVLLLPAAQADDLLTVYRRAQENDPTYRAAGANYQAARQKLPQARASLLPTLSAQADKTRNDNEVVTDAGIVSRPAGRAVFDSTSYTLSLTQPVYNSAIFAGLRQAKAEVRRAEADYAAAKQDLMTRVAEVYFGVLAAEDNLAMARAEKKAIARQLEVAQGRLDVGLATITDVHDARARFELAEAQAIEAANDLEDQRQALHELTGQSMVALSKLRENMPLITPDPPDIDQWVKTALAQNLALRAQHESTKIAREEVKRQRAGHMPTLDIVGSRSRTDADASITGPGVRRDSTAVGLELQVPIFQGGLVSALTTEAKHRYTAAQQELEAQRRATVRATRAAYLGVSSGSAKIGALRQAVIASESALEAKVEGFEAGINTNLDVLDAQRDLFRAKRDYLASRYDYVLNLLRLKQAAGILSEQDLVQANSWLETVNGDL